MTDHQQNIVSLLLSSDLKNVRIALQIIKRINKSTSIKILETILSNVITSAFKKLVSEKDAGCVDDSGCYIGTWFVTADFVIKTPQIEPEIFTYNFGIYNSIEESILFKYSVGFISATNVIYIRDSSLEMEIEVEHVVNDKLFYSYDITTTDSDMIAKWHKFLQKPPKLTKF